MKKKISLPLLGMMPAYLLIGIFAIIPIAIMMYVSFMSSDPYGGFKHIFSLESYIQLLYVTDWDENLVFNPVYVWVIVRSVVLAFMATSICVLLGFPVAYYISRRSSKVKNLLLYLVTLPFWINMIIRVYAWLIILSDEGLLERSLRSVGLIDNVGTFLYNNFATATGMVYSYIPLIILPIYASIEKLDNAYIEVAQDLYANKIRVLFKVILPLCKPGIYAGFILVFIPNLGTVLEPMLLGGGKKMMLGNLIQMQFGVARNWSFGSTLAVVLLVIALTIIAINARHKKQETS